MYSVQNNASSHGLLYNKSATLIVAPTVSLSASRSFAKRITSDIAHGVGTIFLIWWPFLYSPVIRRHQRPRHLIGSARLPHHTLSTNHGFVSLGFRNINGFRTFRALLVAMRTHSPMGLTFMMRLPISVLWCRALKCSDLSLRVGQSDGQRTDEWSATLLYISLYWREQPT